MRLRDPFRAYWKVVRREVEVGERSSVEGDALNWLGSLGIYILDPNHLLPQIRLGGGESAHRFGHCVATRLEAWSSVIWANWECQVFS